MDLSLPEGTSQLLGRRVSLAGRSATERGFAAGPNGLSPNGSPSPALLGSGGNRHGSLGGMRRSMIRRSVAENEARVKVLSENLPPNEFKCVREAFDAFASSDGYTIAESEVPRFFQRVHAPITAELLHALLADVPGEDRGHYSFADVLQVYISWHQLAAVKLMSSAVWEKQPACKAALSTKMWLPDAHLRTVWNVVINSMIMVLWIAVLYRDSASEPGSTLLNQKAEQWFAAICGISTVLFAADIYVVANTVLVKRNGLVDDPVAVRQAYLHGWLIPDVLSAIPLDMILDAAGAHVASAVFTHLRLIRMIRVFFIWEVSGHIPVTPGFILFHYKVLPLVKLFYGMFALMHLFTASFIWVKQRSNGNKPLEGVPYITALYFVTQTFTTVGYGDVELSDDPAELWFAVLVMFLGLLLNGTIIGRLVALLQLGNANEAREEKLRSTLAVLQYFEIPRQLQVEILNFQRHVLWSYVDTAFHDVTAALPEAICDNVTIVYRVAALRQVKCFAEAHDVVLVAMARAMQPRPSKPEEYVSCCTDPHQGIRFLLFGFVDKLDARGRYILTHRTGDVFGLDGIVEMAEEAHNFKALSYCDMLALPADEFHSIIRQFPAFGAVVITSLRQAAAGLGSSGRSGIGSRDMSRSASGAFNVVKDETNNTNNMNIASLRTLHVKMQMFKENLIQLNREF